MIRLIHFVLFITIAQLSSAQCNLELRYDEAGNRIFRGNKCNPDCSIHVLNTNDIGIGSFRDAVYCAEDGDNITFENSLENQLINLNGKILIEQNIDVNKSFPNYIPPFIAIKSNVDDIVLEVAQANTVFLNNLNLIGNAGYNANPRILNNRGFLTLYNITLSDDAQFKGENSTILNSGSLFLLDMLTHIYIFY